jgi:hypothetical protein
MSKLIKDRWPEKGIMQPPTFIVEKRLEAGDEMPPFTAFPITDTSPTEFAFAADDRRCT